jgi:hypothetical protein
MDQEYELSYGFKTFNGRIGAAVMIVEAESLEAVQENALRIVYEDMVEDLKEGVCSLSISIKLK